MRALLLLTLSAVVASCGHPETHTAGAPAAVEEISPAPEILVAAADIQLAMAEVDLAMIQTEVRDAEPEPKPKLLGTFHMTYYWMEQEESSDKKNTAIYTPSCKRIARVNRKFARRLAMEGTGRLEDGRTINVARKCTCKFSPCFFVAKDDHRWGVGVRSRPLSPFRSIAVDKRKIRYGTRVYIAELDGLTMPGAPPWGGFVHDGCVTADDTGGGVKGRQVDFFAAKRQHYDAFFRRHKLTRVTVYDGAERCKDDRPEPEAANRNSI